MRGQHCKKGRCHKATLEAFVLITIFLLSFVVKIYKIESGNYVIWDESHFGKFSTSYLKRQFYFDVHPPLGKLMTALSGLISGQDLKFKFDSGDAYPESLDYCAMRRFHSFVSAFIPLFVYGAMRELGYSMRWCGLFSLFYIFENGMVSISRLILLDPHLLLFTAFVLYSFTRFAVRKGKSRTFDLSILGLSIGLVLSVKWIGCFTMLFVGIYVVHELYRSLKYEPFTTFLSKFAERAFFLIAVPMSIYMFWFFVHFSILVNSSSDEAQMSSLFQLKLRSNSIKKLGKYVEYGYPVTIKASKMTGGNLHSHSHTYPNALENQVTTYHHKDENDEWAFQKVTNGEDDADFLQNGDTVVLVHLATRKYLHAGSQPALVSDGMLVSCTEDLTQSNLWKIEVETDLLGLESCLKSMTTKFRLQNMQRECYLTSSSKQYPEWGFGQGEVTCTKARDESTLWNIEKNEWITPKNTEYKEVFDLKNTFFLHFLELNKAMFKVNTSFKQDEDLEPARIVSRPYEWFILKRGLRMVSWDNEERKKFYMFGNPFIWYLSSVSVLASPIILVVKNIRLRRKGVDSGVARRDFLEVFICFTGWACHYLPFFFMGRVLYFHHYFPAMMFAVLSISYVMRHFKSAMSICIAVSVVSFVIFSPLTYGFREPSIVSHAKLLSSWDFV